MGYLSLPVAWLFCSGMMYADPAQQAEYTLTRLEHLKPDSVMNAKDVGAINGILDRAKPHTAPERLASVIRRLGITNPRFARAGALPEAA